MVQGWGSADGPKNAVVDWNAEADFRKGDGGKTYGDIDAPNADWKRKGWEKRSRAEAARGEEDYRLAGRGLASAGCREAELVQPKRITW